MLAITLTGVGAAGSGKKLTVTEWVLMSLQLVLMVAAVLLAYTCNERSGVHSPFWQAVLAFLFPEIYIAQAAIRYALGEYHCGLGAM